MKTQSFFFKLLSLILFAFFSLNMWGVEPDYVLDATLETNKGTNNSYAGDCDVTVNGITWNVTGNATMNPWRLGGKSITNVDRAVYSKTAYTSAVSRIDLTVGGASSITINSLKLVYSTNADFSNSAEISGTFAANSTISFEPASGDFPENAYYKFVFNVTVSVTSNKYVEFSKVEFYNATVVQTHTINWYVNGIPTSVTVNHGAALTIPADIDTDIECGGKVFVGWCTDASYTNANTAPAGMFTSATGTVTADANYYAVFAKVEGGGGGEVTLTNNVIKDARTGHTSGYYDDVPMGDWTGKYTFNLNNGVYSLQLGYNTTSTNSANNSHLTTPSCPNAITKVVINASSKNSNAATFYLCDNNSVGAAGSEDGVYGSGTLNSGASGSVTINVTGMPTQIHIYPSATVYIDNVVITYGTPITYSNYSTTCEEPVPGTYTANVDGSLENGAINLSKMNGNFVSKSLGDLATSTTYYFQVTPNSGYHIQEGSVKVNNSTTGVTKVSGDADGAVYSYTTGSTNMTISATFVINSYTVTSTLTNVTASPNIPANINHGEAILTTISADTGYDLPNDITVTGGTKSWNSTTGELAVTNVTGNVNISIVGTSAPVHSIVYVAPTTLSGMGYANGDGANSIIKTFTISGRDLTSSATVTASENFEVSQDGTTFAASQTLSASAVLAGITIYVRLESGKGNNTYEGNITVSGPEFTTKEVAVSALVAAGHTVTFKNNRTTLAVGGTRLVADGAQVGTLPVLSGSASCDAIGHPVFIGWSATDFGSTTSAPELVTSSVVITDDVTYYAVFGDEGDNSTSYYKITDLSQLSEGNYVIAGKKDGTSDYYKMKNEIVSNYYLDVAQANPAADIYNSPGAAYIWRLVSTADGWTIYNANVSQYVQILVSGDYNNLTLSDEPYSFTLSPSDGIWAITHNIDGTTRYLTFRQNNQYNEFAARLTQDNPVYLFKQQIESSSWLTYCIGIITYDANGATSGTAPIDNNEYTYGTQANILPNTDLAKTHYTFAGWNTAADGTGTHYEAGNSITINGDVTLYAEWTPDVHTVTWSVNGDASESVNVNYGEKVSSLPSDPDIICGGKDFVGWTTSTIDEETDDAPAVLFTDVASSPIIEANTTFYAVFANGEEGASGSTTPITETLTNEEIYTNITNGKTLAYASSWSYTDGTAIWSGQGYTDANDRHWIQLKKDANVYLKVAVPVGSSITQFKVTLTSASNSSGGINNQSMHTDYSSRALIQTNGSAVSATSTGIDYTETIIDDVVTFNLSSSYNELYFKTVAGSRIWGAQVTYTSSSSSSYTNYSTSCSTLYDLTWHSASGDPQVTQVDGEETIVPITPTECANKTFMGWVDAPINELQQDAPSFIDFSTYTVSSDKDFYAVYASKNGGKVTGTVDVQKWEDKFDPDNSAFLTRWIASDNASWWNDVTNNFARLQMVAHSTTPIYIQIREKIADFSKISFSISRSGGSSNAFSVEYSTDGDNWVALIDHDKSGTATYGFRRETATMSTPMDAYVRIVAYPSDYASVYNFCVDNVNLYTKECSYWYSDYSTSCNMAASTTMTFDANGATGSVDAITTPGWVTLPDGTALAKDCDIFAGWQVTGVTDYTQTFQPGDQYLLNHDVTMTAQWTAHPCATGSLDATASYITTTNGVAKKSVLHTLTITNMDGETITPVISGTDAALFVVTDEVLDLESDTKTYTFRVQYTPAAASTTNTDATLTFTDEAGKPVTDGEGNTLTMTLNGRSVADQIVLAAKVGNAWYALPSDMASADTYTGLPITVDDTANPTTATIVPTNAVYTLNALLSGSTSDASRVRFASTLTNNNALWGSDANNTIRNWAQISTATGDNYDWILTTTDLNSYTLTNNRGGSPRNLSLNTDCKWGLHGNFVASADIRILAKGTEVTYIPVDVIDWKLNTTGDAFSFTTTATIPSYDNVKIQYTGDPVSASMSGTGVYTITSADMNLTSHSLQPMTIQWYSGDNMVAVGSVNVPVFITTADGLLTSYDLESLKTADVYVLNGGKLTVAANCTIRNLTIEGGGVVAVTDKTFSINQLSLHGGLNNVNGSQYAMPHLYVASGAQLTKSKSDVNFDLTVDKRNYYPFAVPFAVNVADIDYVDPVLKTASTYGTHYVIKTYDGAKRAENGENKDENWTVVESSATLKPGVGYIITAVAPAGYDSRIRIPMSIVNGWTANGELGTCNDVTRNVVAVTAYTGTAAATQQRHAGWNFVADPYLTAFAGSNISTSEGLEVVYASIPTYDFSEYIQTPLSEAVLSPEWGFFVQTATTGTMTFATTGRQQMAPRYLMAENDTPVFRKLQTALVLNSNTDKSDRAGLIISDRYSAAYEIGADLEKMFGSGYTLATYTLVNGTRLAYNAMSEAEAHQLIPVGYRAPEAGSYTFSLDITDDMAAYFERIDLIDYETGELTNLLTNHYTFITERMQNDSRFAINATVRKVPTRLDDGIPNMGDGVQKVIYDEHLYIIDHNKVYDGTGSLITITK